MGQSVPTWPMRAFNSWDNVLPFGGKGLNMFCTFCRKLMTVGRGDTYVHGCLSLPQIFKSSFI